MLRVHVRARYCAQKYIRDMCTHRSSTASYVLLCDYCLEGSSPYYVLSLFPPLPAIIRLSAHFLSRRIVRDWRHVKSSKTFRGILLESNSNVIRRWQLEKRRQMSSILWSIYKYLGCNLLKYYNRSFRSYFYVKNVTDERSKIDLRGMYNITTSDLCIKERRQIIIITWREFAPSKL